MWQRLEGSPLLKIAVSKKNTRIFSEHKQSSLNNHLLIDAKGCFPDLGNLKVRSLLLLSVILGSNQASTTLITSIASSGFMVPKVYKIQEPS